MALDMERSHGEGVEGKCRKDKGGTGLRYRPEVQAWTSCRVQANTHALYVLQE